MIRPSFMYLFLLSAAFTTELESRCMDREIARAEARALERSNTFLGFKAGNNGLQGSENVGLGMFSFSELMNGSYNIGIGSLAGSSLEEGDSNIYIGNEGKNNESHIIRIGTPGNSDGQQNKVFIAGIDGTPVSGIPVVVAANGQLGQQASSVIYKHTISAMGAQSDAILDIPTYSFYYDTSIDPDQSKQYGFMAEDIVTVYPELITNDSDGNPCYIQYFNIIPLILSELQKLEARVTALEA